MRPEGSRRVGKLSNLSNLSNHHITKSPHHQILKPALDSLYAGFNHPESALDPIQIVRRYPRVDDREIVAFVAAGLAFGRVASVMNSVDAVCAVMGPHPAAFVRAFDPNRDGARLRPIVHRWIGGTQLIALFVTLRHMLASHGSIEAFFDEGRDDAHEDLGPAIESFSTRALSLVRLREPRTPEPRTQEPEPRNPVVTEPRNLGTPEPRNLRWFFSRPPSACKRLNLFLRWMIRRDGVDPGGWTRVPTRQLVVPLDTHTIRAGKCLRLTRRASPGWPMAAEITDALRAIDRDDPVRYDFSLCHLSMMGACGYGTKQRDTHCPLRGHCRPGRLRAR